MTFPVGVQEYTDGKLKPTFLTSLLLALGFVVMGAASIQLSRLGDGIAGIWLANAFAYVFLARQRRAFGLVEIVILIGVSLAVNIAFGSSGEMALLHSTANIFNIGVGLYLTRKLLLSTSLERLGAREFGLVLGLAGGLAAAIAGLVFGLTSYMINGSSAVSAGWAWFSANALGFAILLPTMAFVTRPALAALLDVGAIARLLSICAGCIVIAWLSLSSGQFLFTIAMLPLLVLTPRLSVFELAIVCSSTGVAAVVVAMAGLVPSLDQGVTAFNDGFQIAVAATVLMPFLGGLFVRQMIEDGQRIKEAETRWNFALASAGQGVWDFDQRKGRVTYSKTWNSLLGYDGDEFGADPDRWLTLVHADDYDRVAAADREHMEGRTPYFEAEFRMRHKSGRWIWILDQGKAVERDENGYLVRAIGVVTDITERKETEYRLAISAAMLAAEKERLRVTLQSIGDAVICTDAADNLTFVNPLAEKLLGVKSSDAVGLPFDRIYCTVDEETGTPLDLRRINDDGSKGVHANNRAVLIRHDQTRRSVRQVVSPIIDERGEFCGSVVVFQDFTDARALQRQLAYAATHDALTGLSNRSYFMRKADEILAMVQSGSAERYFMFLDLDNFKQVNDTGGHAAGDALLKRVAETIRANVDQDQLVARLGGDEFAVVVETDSIAKAEQIAHSIVDAISCLDLVWNGKKQSIGVSVGIAAITADSGEVDEIIALADVACYAAKAAGRGCVCVAPRHRSVSMPNTPATANAVNAS